MANLPNAGVAVVASPTGASLTGPTDNAALGLAHALGHFSEQADSAMQQWAVKKKGEAETRAKADAMKTSGTAFADAVRTGKIEKTQNPWYIQQYEQQAAQVRGEAAVSAKATEAAGWAERNDPKAFADRWNSEVGQIGEQFASPDQAQGFQAAAAPLTQQVLNSNTAYNVQRIKDEHTQNISTLTTKAILDAKTANGDHPTPDQVFAAMEPQHKEWLATGGTEADWNMLVVNSVIAAGTNSGDPSLLNVLKDERGGKGALANIAGPDGKPVAQTVSSAQYYIEQAAEAAGMAEVKAHKNQVAAEGYKAEQSIWDTYGYDFINGNVPKAEIVKTLMSNGYSPEAADFAIGQLAESASKNLSLSNSLMGGDPEIADLYTEASRTGFSPQLQSRAAELLRQDRLPLTEYEQVISTAQSRTNHLESEGRADARAARSDARQSEADNRRLQADHATDLKNNRAQSLGQASTALQKLGDRSLLDPKVRTQQERAATDAEGSWLKSHPGDIAGAMSAADSALNTYVTTRIARMQKKPPASGNPRPGANPRK